MSTVGVGVPVEEKVNCCVAPEFMVTVLGPAKVQVGGTETFDTVTETAELTTVVPTS